MTALNISNFEKDELTVEPALEGVRATVLLRGSATAYQPNELRDYLQGLHAELVANKVEEVVVDMRELEFMNSSGFSTFIDWLVALQEEEAAAQYKVRYLSNSEYSWQRRSLHALQCLAADLVTIETDE